MKTSIKNFAYALVFVVTASFAANAENKEANKSAGFETGIYTSKSGKINVLVNKVSANAPTTLLVKNASGEVVYRESINKHEQKFGRALNLDDLEAGKYQIEISSKGITQTKSFELSEQKVERVLAIK